MEKNLAFGKECGLLMSKNRTLEIMHRNLENNLYFFSYNILYDGKKAGLLRYYRKNSQNMFALQKFMNLKTQSDNMRAYFQQF